jgi:molecular chaperone GrpE (heat shock protein)
MAGWLQRLLGRTEDGGTDAERLLALERGAQELRLRLKEANDQLAALREECERLRAGEAARVADAVRDRLERVLTDAAGPAAQLVTQAHLLEAEGKPVQARDVLAVARRLVRVLEGEGLTLEGRVGERAAFDPARHAPLGGDAVAPGQPVVVRFVGVSCRGRVLRKAGVDKEQG